MRFHTRTKHEGMLFPCNRCDFKSATKDGLNVHTAFTHDGEVYSCNDCDQLSSSKKALKIHKLARHTDKIYECDQCEYKCAANSFLSNHKRKQHDKLKMKQENRTHPVKTKGDVHCFEINCKSSSKEFCIELEHNKLSCLECEYHAYSKRTLRDHKRKQHEGQIYFCGQCDKKFALKFSLKRHTQEAHKKLLCGECNYFAYAKRTMQHHNRRVHDHVETPSVPTADEKFREKKHTVTVEDCDEYDEEDEDKFVMSGEIKDAEGKEENCDKSVPQFLQHKDSETQMSKLENLSKFNCNDCSFTTQNQNISKLHHLSHKFSESEIFKTIPSSLKNLTFNSEAEFSKNIEMFLTSLPVKDL